MVIKQTPPNVIIRGRLLYNQRLFFLLYKQRIIMPFTAFDVGYGMSNMFYRTLYTSQECVKVF
jgi:hypothetical protein